MKEVQALRIVWFVLVLIVFALLLANAFDFGCYRNEMSEATGRWFVNTQSFMETETGVQCWTWPDGKSCGLFCLPLSAMPTLSDDFK